MRKLLVVVLGLILLVGCSCGASDEPNVERQYKSDSGDGKYTLVAIDGIRYVSGYRSLSVHYIVVDGKAVIDVVPNEPQPEAEEYMNDY